MKNVITVSVVLSLILGSVAYAETAYTSVRDTRNSNNTEDYSARIDANRTMWNQTVRSYEVNNNDSMRRYWDAYTEAYQKQKKIQH